jgi:ankyrin repeat protein
VDEKDIYGETALMWAAHSGHANCVKALIGSGAGVNFQSYEGLTALMWVVKSGNPDSVKALLAAGAKVNVTNDEGWTPLMHSKLPDVVAILKEAGAAARPLSCVGR